MASATIAEIRQGLADALDTAFGLTVQTSPYQIEAPTPPTLHVMGIDQITYDRANNSGLDEVMISIQGIGGPMSEGAQMVLDGWLGRGPGTVLNAIHADRTLGGKVATLAVTGSSDYRLVKLLDGTVMYGCDWQIRIFNTG